VAAISFDIDALIRRLLLLGIPLLPAAGCLADSSCPSSAPTTERYVEIAKPSDLPNSGQGSITVDAYQRCADALDCADLCQEYFSPMVQFVENCVRVPTPTFASGTERIGLRARTGMICEGRRPEGLPVLPPPLRACDEAGAFLARAAYLEGVSVPAFQRLGRELAAHGAPAALVRAAARAERDEVRHRRSVTALARRFGAEPPAIPRSFPAGVRPVEAVAIENAAEGCVRETVGAIVAREQAGRADDRAVRACFGMVARDEARHAALAFAVDSWARSRLDGAACARVDEARDAAVAEVAREVDESPTSPLLVRQLGLPPAGVARALLAGLGGWLRHAGDAGPLSSLPLVKPAS
jgi:hypothetical protein